MGNGFCVFCGCIQQSNVGIIERWGRFERLAEPGLHFFNPFAGQFLAGILSTRINSLDVRIETKTKDNVFVQMHCSIQYRVVKSNADDAFYELQNPQEQIQAYVFDVVRAHVPRMTIDELFEQKGDVAEAVQEELEKVIGAYGYSIEHILMVDIIPDTSVRKAMNEINAAQRLQLASVYKGEADKILLVKKAEAEAESKYLGGVGVARQRQAITDGLRENILNFSHKIEGTSAKEVMDLIMITQYFDTIKDLGNSSKNTTVFLPHGPGHVRDIGDQIRNGIEVNPGKPYVHRFDEERGRLQLSQATLGSGSSTKKSILQCQVGENNPIYLCSLLPDRIETCTLNLEFAEEDEVIFSVQGPQSIHLSGFFIGESEDPMGDAYESDPYGEEISGTESDDSSDYNSEESFEGDFDDRDMDMYPSYRVPKSGVVIEEMEDDKPATNNGTSKYGKKKKRLTASANNNSERQLVKGNTGDQILESEDEDGFPILSNDKSKADASSSKEKPKEVKDKRSNEKAKIKKAKDEGSLRCLKRKIDTVVGDKEEKSESGQQPGSSPAETLVSESDTKQKGKNKNKKANNEEAMQLGDEGHQKKSIEKNIGIDANSAGEEKKNKKRSKKQGNAVEATVNQPVANMKESPQEKTNGKSTQVRTFPNGLVIEEVTMGKADGKKASPGKKVSVRYIGKLKKNGEIFDSNVGRAPFKFRLGVGQVIKGWDVGISGMRVGDKRRLTIPPAMGYGSQGAGKAIPPNSWLVFDVELVAVN